jgi:hypothetical protein
VSKREAELRHRRERELGIEFKPDNGDEHRADVLKDLKLSREIVREALFEGEWV